MASWSSQFGVNRGTDDDFHVQPGSPAIDAGNPTTPSNLEPSPNGGRVNQGYDGDTPQAQTSSASQSLQLINPAQFAKYEVGEQVPITIDASNVGQTQAVTAAECWRPSGRFDHAGQLATQRRRYDEWHYVHRYVQHHGHDWHPDHVVRHRRRRSAPALR